VKETGDDGAERNGHTTVVYKEDITIIIITKQFTATLKAQNIIWTAKPKYGNNGNQSNEHLYSPDNW